MVLSEILEEETLWQMSLSERASFLYILGELSPKNIAVEIGTNHGGSLQWLSKFFKKVYSCDIDHSHLDKNKYNNVEWVLGHSKDTIPKLLENLSKEEINFVLIDASHKYENVYNDIKNVLTYIPKNDMIILMHDSWYPPTRKAILDFNWNQNLYVHYINTDFATGDLMIYNDKDVYMGGFCLIILKPEKRINDIEIKQTYNYMYNKVMERIG
jgi:hypothetical protein